MRSIRPDSTSQSVVIRIVDATDGTPETGVVWNTSGIDMWYRREGAASVDITEATLAALTTAWTNGGFLHINDGYYRLDVPNEAFVDDADGVMIGGAVTGMVVIGCYIPLNLPDLVWDEPLTAAEHNVANSSGRRLRNLQDFGVYEGGAVWVDTVNGTTGQTTDFENGTVNNPVNDIDDAKTIADSVGLKVFHILPGSGGTGMTLGGSFAGYEFIGFGYTIILAGQSMSGSLVAGATVSGNDGGTNTLATVYLNCTMGENVLGIHKLSGCGLSGTTAGITFAEAGTYDWDQCFSRVAGTGTPDVTFAAGNMNLNMRHYSGGINIEGMGAAASTDNMSLEGHGQVTEGTCTAGTVAIRGNFTRGTFTNLTPSDDARIDIAQINAQADAAIETYHLDHLLHADYDPASKPGTATALLNELVESNAGVSRYTAAALAQGPSGGTGLSALDSGTLIAATSTTAQLPAARTFADDALNGNTINIISGTGIGQSRVITDYTLITPADTCTVTPAWTTTPNATSGYEIVQGSTNVAAWSDAPVVVGTSNLPSVDATAISDSTSAADLVQANIGNLDAASSTLSTFDETTTGVEIRSTGGTSGHNAADLVTDIWDEDIVLAHQGANAAGRNLATLDSISDRTNNPTLNALLGVADVASTNLADAIWDEDVDAVHQTAGSAGKKLDDTGATVATNLDAAISSLNDLDAATAADAVWNELSTGHTDAGKAGAQMWTDVDNILSDTTTLHDTRIPEVLSLTNILAQVVGGLDAAISTPTAGSVAQRVEALDLLTEAAGSGDLASILTQITSLDGTKIPDTVSLANIKTQVTDATGTDTIAELGVGVPAATPTIETAIMWLYMMARNEQTQNATTQTVKNDAGATIASSTVTEAAGLITRGEFA